MNNDALFDLTGKIAVVTGGGDGIGYCISLPPYPLGSAVRH